MKRVLVAVLLIAAAALVATPRAEAEQFKATLKGFEEVPAVSNLGKGTLNMEVNAAGTEIAWELTLPNARPTSPRLTFISPKRASTAAS